MSLRRALTKSESGEMPSMSKLDLKEGKKLLIEALIRIKIAGSKKKDFHFLNVD